MEASAVECIAGQGMAVSARNMRSGIGTKEIQMTSLGSEVYIYSPLRLMLGV